MTWAVEHRPQTFAEVVGQEHIAPALRRMVATARDLNVKSVFPPALTLYGPRGTGKTTIARILARALNCLDPTGATSPGEPCGQCPMCQAIASGASAGVTEMDIASAGSVDDMRSLKQSAMFSLAEDWRVYLLDEVHSASRQAFDALLKILEEPPPKTLFLLVTTEPERIPETIQSRSMPFEFRRIPSGLIITHLQEVAAHHDVATRIDEEVYPLLAVRARGGLRDAVMSLEQLTLANDGHITSDIVREQFGVTRVPEEVLDAAIKGDLTRGLAVLSSDGASSVSPLVLIDGMIDGCVGLLSVGAGVDPDPGRPVSPAWLRAVAPGLSPDLISRVLDVLWDARGRMRAGETVASGAILFAAFARVVGTLSQGGPARPPLSHVASPLPPSPSGLHAPLPAPASSGPITSQAVRELLSSRHTPSEVHHAPDKDSDQAPLPDS